MKHSNTFKKCLLWLISTAFLLPFACKRPTEGLKIAVNTDISSVVYTFQILDAKSLNELPINEIYSITIGGNDADLIYSLNGDRKFKFNDGFLTIMVKPGFKPSELRPLKFSIVIRNKNALKTIVPVYLTQPDNYFKQIPIVRYDNLPDGVSTTTNNIKTNSEGKTETELRIETPLTNGKTEKTELTIPKNTQFLDKSGNPITGDIQIRLVHFDSRNTGSLSSFPGGFQVFDARDAQNQPIGNGLFQTAGFLAMDMNSNDKEVSSFSQPLQIKMTVDAQIKDPTSNQNIKQGDQIPFWSLNTENGQWQQMGNSNISYDANTQQYSAQFSTDQRRWLNLDYLFNGCRGNSDVILNYNGPYIHCKYFIEYEDNRYSYLSHNPEFINLFDGRRINLSNFITERTSIRLRFINPENNEEIGVTPYFLSCERSQNINLDYQTTNPTITAYVSGICPNNGRIIKPTGPVYFHESTQSIKRLLGIMKNGEFKTSTLQAGKSYEIHALDGDQNWISTSLSVPMDWAEKEVDFNWEMEIKEFSGCR